jgi:hypothetical protein
MKYHNYTKKEKLHFVALQQIEYHNHKKKDKAMPCLYKSTTNQLWKITIPKSAYSIQYQHHHPQNHQIPLTLLE